VRHAALALALVAALAAPAGADPAQLDRAQQAIDDIDYEAAKRHVSEALEAGGLSLRDHLRALRIAGEVEAALGDVDAARRHFATWILLAPDAALPGGLSPKITEPFEAARAEVAADGPFAVEVRLERTGGQVQVLLDVQDPLSLIAGFDATAGDATVRGTGTSAELAAGDGRVTVEVSVFDQRGNQLAVERAVLGPAAAAPPPARTAPGRSGFPAIVRWPTWAGLAVVAAGTGGYFTWRVGQAEDDLAALNADPAGHSVDEARAIQDRGERDAMVSNVLYGVAGAAAIAAILTFVLEPDDDVEVLPTAGADRAGVTAIVRF
jgi:hypothetical protein